jgi:hypothetical protein
MALYGRDDLAWDELARAGLEFLLERARLEKLTSTRLVQGPGEHAISAAQLSSRMTFVQVLVVCGASLPGLTRLPPTRPVETVRSSP